MSCRGAEFIDPRRLRRTAWMLAVLLPASGSIAQTTQPAVPQTNVTAPAVSAELEALQRRYATVRSIRVASLRNRELGRIVEAVVALPAATELEELDARVALRIGSLAHAERTEEAVAALHERVALWRNRCDSGGVATRALEAFGGEMANRQYCLAEMYCAAAQEADLSPAGMFRAILARGRLISARDGDAACAEYFLHIVAERESRPIELIHEVHYQAAEALFRSRQLDRAFAALDAMEKDYAGTPAEERARHTRRGWQGLLDADKSQGQKQPTTRRTEENP